MSLVTSGKGANKLMAHICPGGYGVVRQMHEPGPNVGLEHQREVVGKHLAISSPGSLHRDGVDAEELRRVGLAVVLLANVGLERAGSRTLQLP